MKQQKTVCALLQSVQIGMEQYPINRDKALMTFITRNYLDKTDIEQTNQEFCHWQQLAHSQGFRLAKTGLFLTAEIITVLNEEVIRFNVTRDIVINAYFIKLLYRLKNEASFLAF